MNLEELIRETYMARVKEAPDGEAALVRLRSDGRLADREPQGRPSRRRWPILVTTAAAVAAICAASAVTFSSIRAHQSAASDGRAAGSSVASPKCPSPLRFSSTVERPEMANDASLAGASLLPGEPLAATACLIGTYALKGRTVLSRDEISEVAAALRALPTVPPKQDWICNAVAYPISGHLLRFASAHAPVIDIWVGGGCLGAFATNGYRTGYSAGDLYQRLDQISRMAAPVPASTLSEGQSVPRPTCTLWRGGDALHDEAAADGTAPWMQATLWRDDRYPTAELHIYVVSDKRQYVTVSEPGGTTLAVLGYVRARSGGWWMDTWSECSSPAGSGSTPTLSTTTR
jgi:hypothetical protein